MSEYEVYSLVIQAMGAIGTVGAVVVALYLAKKNSEPNIRVEVGIRWMISQRTTVREKNVTLRVTNCGIVDEYIGMYEYSILFFSWARRCIIIPSPRDGLLGLNSKIEPGQTCYDIVSIGDFVSKQAQFFFDAIDFVLDKFQFLPAKVRQSRWLPMLVLKTARCNVSVRRGGSVSTRLEKAFLEFILEQYRAHRE